MIVPKCLIAPDLQVLCIQTFGTMRTNLFQEKFMVLVIYSAGHEAVIKRSSVSIESLSSKGTFKKSIIETNEKSLIMKKSDSEKSLIINLVY